jgi:CheY-like chemotaxis protein
MPEGGQLTIATANCHLDDDYAKLHPDVAAGDYVMTMLTDTGIGMTQDVVARIFDPFYTTKKVGMGTGLGLSMVFGFVKQSGGHVTVYSEPGIGSTFRLYLPRLLGDMAEEESPRQTELTQASGETVLAVEDNAALRRVVVRQLTELGYRVMEAANVTDALEMLASEKVDLLFSDVVMPGALDGYALARQATALWPGIKVLLTSGFPVTRGIGTSTAPTPTRQLLSKPYRRDELARALRIALDT